MPASPPHEVQALRRCIRDVTVVSGLPAQWAAQGPAHAAESLANALLETLDLDVVFVSAGRLIETARERPSVQGAPGLLADAVRRVALDRISGEPLPQVIDDPRGAGQLRLVDTPFVIAGEAGSIVAASRRADFPSESEAVVLRIAARQFAIVMEWARAEGETLAREQRLRRQNLALGELAKLRVMEGGKLDATVRHVTETAARTLGVERVGVWLYDPGRTCIRCVDLYELSGDRHSAGVELRTADYPTYFEAVGHESVIAAADARTDPRTHEFTESYLQPLGITSMMDAPIRLHGRLVGVVCHEHVGPARQWSVEEQSFTASIADAIAMAIEADEHHRAQEALRASEARYRELFGTMPVGVFLCDREGVVQDYNDHAAKLWGREPKRGDPAERYCGSPRLFLPDGRPLPHERSPLVRVLETGARAENVEAIIERLDGSRVSMIVNFSPLKNDRGEVTGAITCFQDITEQKQAEASLKDQAHTLSILNRVSSAVNAELELDTVVQMVTDAGTELSGARFGGFFYNDTDGADREVFTLSTLSGPYREAFKRFPMPRTTPIFKRIFGGEGVVRINDVEHDPRSGGEPHHGLPPGLPPMKSVLAAPVISRSGKVIGGLFFGHPDAGVFTERTERLITGIAAHAAVAIDNAQLYRSAQQELAERRRAEKDLEALNQTLERRVEERTAEVERRATQLRALASQLHRVEQRERRRLGQVLHDHLQQLLVAAMIQLDVAAKTKGSARAVKTAAEHAGQLVRESIEVSRSLTADLSPPVLYEGSLSAVLNWLARHMEERHGLHVEVDAPDEEAMDGLTEDRRVLLFQAVRELLFNVVKHAGVDRATVRMRCDYERVEVAVEDRGCGLRLEEIAPGSHTTGGFGLMSMRERLEYLGGRLAVESDPGRFTRIQLTVPADRVAVAEEPAVVALAPGQPDESEAPVAKRSARPGRIRVMLADDHKVLRDGLVGLLRAQPNIHVVGEASDGQQAVDLARKLRPDVVVMDISMPGLSGIEATRQITRQMPGIRIVGLSMHEEADMTASMIEAGAEMYLTKGGPAEDLVAAICRSARPADPPTIVEPV